MAVTKIGGLTKGVSSGRQTAEVTLTAGQVRALNSTVQEIIPSPGAGFVTEIESAYAHKASGTAFAGVAAGEDIELRYTDASGLQVAEFETTGWLTLTTASIRHAQLIAGAATSTPVPNAPIVLRNSGAITGGRAVTFTVHYYINRIP